MKLKKLLQNLPDITIKGGKDIEITGLCNDSKQAAPGYLFFAKKGFQEDGNQYIAEAVSAGVLAVVTDLYNPFLPKIVQIIHPDVDRLESILTDRFYESPSEKLLTVGITGTNGKTTTAYLIKYLFDRLGIPSGLIGTVEWIVGNNIFPSTRTTPDIVTNQKLLKEMLLSGCKSVVMEVSSHGLDQGRVRNIDFDIAVFTNLTSDHLDYHKTEEAYAAAKTRLFTSLRPLSPNPKKPYPKRAVLCADSPFSEVLRPQISVPVLTYGFAKEATVRGENLSLSPRGSSCSITYLSETCPFQTPLVGHYNVRNCLAAITVGVAAGYPLEQVIRALSGFRGVPGRMERVENGEGKHIFVDYAHTEDALKNVLSSLREITSGKIVCLFGCGGNRDRTKRPKMGSIAKALSDRLILTSDNPRNESPERILEEIVSGISDTKDVVIEPDRRKAIGIAIAGLGPEDVLLIAGKGHETYQVFAGESIHFDDRIVAKEYCR